LDQCRRHVARGARLMRPAFVAGVGNTPFGRLEGRDALDLMAAAASAALEDAGRPRAVIDSVLCGYATTTPHLMLSTLFCERAGIRPAYAHAMQLGGATGGAMIMLARELVRAGRCENVLVVAGENRATGQARDSSIQTLAQVGDADFEVPYGASVPAYYALLASRYMHETGLTEADLAEFAVLMRRHAMRHPDAHLREPITLEDVLASKPIASPLKLLDCCPISDGAMALVISAKPAADAAVGILGAGQAHRHQHLSAIEDTTNHGARDAAQRAFAEFALAPRGGCARRLRDGDFALDGPLPLNPHGGLLSFGHCGVAGGMGHAVEAFRQLAGRAGDRQLPGRRRAFVHADGGVMSS